MKNKLISMIVVSVLAVISLFTLVACSNASDSDSGSGELTKLSTPTNLSVDLSAQRLTWNAVAGAIKYRVDINATSRASYEPTTNQLDLSTLSSNVGTTYSITVQAIADSSKGLDSDKSAAISYTVQGGGSGLSSEAEITAFGDFEYSPIDKRYRLVVSKALEYFDFNQVIQVSAGATWQAYISSIGDNPNNGNEIPNNIAELEPWYESNQNLLAAGVRITVTAEDIIHTKDFSFYILKSPDVD